MAPAGTLVRVVAAPAGRLRLGRSLPGRGAWLCRDAGSTGHPGAGSGDRPNPACVGLAVRRHAFERALRAPVVPGAGEELLADNL